MYAEGYITREEGLRALATPLRFLERRPNHYREVEPMFSEVVRQQVAQEFGADAVLNGGLRIWTTLDPRVQAMAERAVRDGLNALARRQRMSPVQASLDDDQARLWNRRARESIAQRPLLPDQEPAGLVTGFSGDPGIPGTFLAIGGETGFLPAGESAWIAGRRKPSDFFRLNDLVMVRLVARDPATGIWILETAPPPEIQGALVLIENATGKVLAMVGGRDFGIEGVGNSDFNRAVLALRQPGSSFKPFVYAAAIDNGYTEASVVYDEPVSYPDGSGRSWSPRNYGGGHAGPITLYEAIKRSVNVVAVKLCDALGPQTVIGYARRMGITSELTPSLSLALGASEVTLLDLAKAYTTFPNQGSWVWPTFVTRVEDRFGRPLLVPEPYFTEAISPQTAYIMVDMLTGVATRGTAARVGAALRGVPVAGKTGTTNSLADALFVGFTPRYTCGVWVGRETRVTLGSGEQGGRTAAPIFIEFMKGFLEGQEPGRFEVPDGVVRRRLLDPEEEDYDLGAGVSYVFRLGEEGQGRHSDTPRWDEDYAADEGPQDAPALSQEEMDRRLEAYLAGYQAF
jgi:penicillin-binding protein 1A